MDQHRVKEGVQGLGVDIRLYCFFLILFRLHLGLSLLVCCCWCSEHHCLYTYMSTLREGAMFVLPSLYTQCLAYNKCLINLC